VTEPLRIGQILQAQGVLSEQQVFEIREAQRRLHEPFGVLAERLFDVTVESIEHAWAEQYHRFTGTIDLADEAVDEQARSLITRRQAWQFELLPMRFESTGELLAATSRQRLARAVVFAANRIPHVVYFRVADADPLRAALQKHYPMPEVPAALLQRALRNHGAHKRSA